MVDFMGMMKKAEELQRNMQAMQDEVGRVVVEGQSGGGLVTVSLTGKGEMKGLRIDPSLFKEDDVAVLEDLILAAHNEARSKVEQLVASKMAEMTQGMPLPPGLRLPF